jgi:hypothetical protein
MGSGIHKTTIKNIDNILKLLKEVGEIHVRGISKTLNLNPFVVSNIIENYLDYFVEIRNIDQFGFRIKLIRLKSGMENTNLEDVLKYVKLKKKIKHI